jgi:hypothetical protein
MKNLKDIIILPKMRKFTNFIILSGNILCHFLDKLVYIKKHTIKLLIINKFNQFNIYLR